MLSSNRFTNCSFNLNYKDWVQHPNSLLSWYDTWLDISGIYLPIEKGFPLFFEELIMLSKNEHITTKGFNVHALWFNFKRQLINVFIAKEDSNYCTFIFYFNGICPNVKVFCTLLEIDYKLFKEIFYGEYE